MIWRFEEKPRSYQENKNDKLEKSQNPEINVVGIINPPILIMVESEEFKFLLPSPTQNKSLAHPSMRKF